jgi:hypothetical protein
VERETWRVYFAQMAAQQNRERRQEEKRQIAHEIAVLKAMQKAGAVDPPRGWIDGVGGRTRPAGGDGDDTLADAIDPAR